MPNPDEAKKSNKDASDLLMEDFHQFAESFWKNEQTGETRVNWFIGIVAAAAGGLFGLSSAEHGPSGAQLRLIVVVSLFALLAFGIGTLFRMIKRNATTDDYLRGLNIVRKLFNEHFDNDDVLFDYKPVGRRKQLSDTAAPSSKKPRAFGGLADTVLTINSLLVAGLAGAIVYPFHDSSFRGVTDDEAFIWTYLAGAAAFVSAFTGQYKFVRMRDRRSLEEPGVKKTLTHAGGVVYQMADEQAQYLLVGGSVEKPNEWLLPKGHIKKGEHPTVTAVREVGEEAGVFACPICLIGRNDFTAPNKEHVRADYYLMERLSEIPREEKRRVRWFEYDEALKIITYPNDKRLLQRADRTRSANAKILPG